MRPAGMHGYQQRPPLLNPSSFASPGPGPWVMANRGANNGGGRFGQDPQDRGNLSERLVPLSRALARVLRHYATSLGLRVEEGGWCNLEELLASSDLKGWNEEDVREVIRESFSKDKPRFELKDEGGAWIRATHKHTIQASPGGGGRSIHPPRAATWNYKPSQHMNGTVPFAAKFAPAAASSPAAAGVAAAEAAATASRGQAWANYQPSGGPKPPPPLPPAGVGGGAAPPASRAANAAPAATTPAADAAGATAAAAPGSKADGKDPLLDKDPWQGGLRVGGGASGGGGASTPLPAAAASAASDGRNLRQAPWPAYNLNYVPGGTGATAPLSRPSSENGVHVAADEDGQPHRAKGPLAKTGCVSPSTGSTNTASEANAADGGSAAGPRHFDICDDEEDSVGGADQDETAGHGEFDWTSVGANARDGGGRDGGNGGSRGPGGDKISAAEPTMAPGPAPTAKVGEPTASAAEASPSPAASPAAAPARRVWHQYQEEASITSWWWNEVDNQWFLERQPGTWQKFADPESGRRYWWKDDVNWFWEHTGCVVP